MTVLSQAETTLLRTRPHQTKLWLSVFQPTVVLACLVNDAGIARGERVITYDTVSTGSYTNIQADYVMLIGTSAGASDIGRIRVRSATSTQITVAENSDIAWANNQFLTVLKYIDIVPIYPRIIQDPAKATNVIFYKDYDIAYTNQNSVLGSFICMTDHKAGFRDPASGVYQAYWTASGTYNVKGESLAYSWEFEGGSPSTFVGLEPGYVNYATPGHYQAKITVTGSSANDVSYRYVSVYDRPEAGTNVPILRWQLSDWSNARDGGTASAKIRIYDNIDIVQANSLIVIFADEWYGNTQISLGGNAKNNSTIKFVGYVVGGTISYNWRESYVEFEVLSPTGLMAKKQGFSVSCESKASPSTWFEIQDLTVTRAMYHYLRWHSTVLKVCDFQYTGPDLSVQYFDADRTSLYDSIAQFVQLGLGGEVTSDMQGKIWVEISAGATPSSETAFPIALTLDKQDWKDEPNVTERLQNDVSYLEYGGIAYSGISTGTFKAMLAGAPGVAPSYAGEPDRQEGFILTTQSQLNSLVGNVFAYKNSRFPDIEFVMSGNYANLDTSPIQRVRVNIARTDTARGITLTNAPFHPTRISWEYDEHNQILIPTVNTAQLVNGVAGETITIPPAPPSSGFKTPKISIPSIPAITIPDFSFDLTGLTTGILGYDSLGSFGSTSVDGYIDWSDYGIIGTAGIPGISWPDLSQTYPNTSIKFSVTGIFLITIWAAFTAGSNTIGISSYGVGGDWPYDPESANADAAGTSARNTTLAIMHYSVTGTGFRVFVNPGTNFSSAMIQIARLF